MRIFFILSALCVSALAWAAPFGHLENVAVKPSLFLADKLAKQQPITYCVELGAKETLDISLPEAALYIRAALKEWTYGIALQIETAGRGKEFAAVIPLLKNARFQQVACDLSAHPAGADYFAPSGAPRQADISILISKNYCETYFRKSTAFYMEDYKSAAPFICVMPRYAGLLQNTDRIAVHILNAEQKAVLAKRLPLLNRIAQEPYTPADQRHLWQLNRLYSYDGPTYFAAITHELGHAFGLADEYTANNLDPLHQTSTPGQGIMRRLYDPIGCAETEGMLTLLGRYGKGPRAFAGFCPNSAFYTDGVEQVAQITPVKRRLSKGVQTLWSLTPDTPKARTLLYESWGPHARGFANGVEFPTKCASVCARVQRAGRHQTRHLADCLPARKRLPRGARRLPSGQSCPRARTACFRRPSGGLFCPPPRNRPPARTYGFERLIF